MVEKFEREYAIRTYECDKRGDLRLITLFNIFQDMADTHASNMGLGLEYCMDKGFAWVGSNYHVKINRLPKLHEKIKVSTWPAVEKKLGAIRDFVVFSEKGEKIISAASQWILIDVARKRPLGLKDNLSHYEVVDDRAMDQEFNVKMADLEKTDKLMNFNVRFDDIDINNHVNNAVYPLWASEAVDAEFRFSHSPEEVEIAFKKECHPGERVTVLTQIDGTDTIHSIKSQTDDRELSKVKIKWKKL